MTDPTTCICTWQWARNDHWVCPTHGPITVVAGGTPQGRRCRNARHDHVIHQGGASCDRTPRPYPPEHVAVGWAVYAAALAALAGWAAATAAYDHLRGKR